MDEKMKRLTEVFRDVFDDDALELTPETEIKSIEGWDSLLHVTLMAAVQDEFGLHLGAKEIMEIGTAGGILAALEGAGQ